MVLLVTLEQKNIHNSVGVLDLKVQDGLGLVGERAAEARAYDGLPGSLVLCVEVFFQGGCDVLLGRELRGEGGRVDCG